MQLEIASEFALITLCLRWVNALLCILAKISQAEYPALYSLFRIALWPLEVFLIASLGTANKERGA